MIRANTSEHEVLRSLRRAYKRKIRSEVWNGCVLVIAAAIAILAGSGILELVFNFGVAGRTVLFFVSLFTLFYVAEEFLVRSVIRYLRVPRNEDIAAIALEVGDSFPELRDRLRNAVDLMTQHPTEFHSRELADAYIESIFATAARFPVASTLRYRVGKKTELYFAGTFGLGIILFLLLPTKIPSSIIKVANFSYKYVSPPAFLINVQPGNTELSRGDTLKAKVKLGLAAAGRFPLFVTFLDRYVGEEDFERHQVKETSTGEYDFSLPNVRSPLEYFVQVGSEKSEHYRVKVVDLPIVQSFLVRLVYPSYTGKGTENLDPDIGDFTALIGTRAEYTLTANKNLNSAWIEFGSDTNATNGARLQLAVDGNSASGSFWVTHSATYSLRLLDVDSLRNRDPIRYSIQAVADQYPTCQIVYPGRDVNLNRDLQLPLRIVISDDYGFTKLLLEYRLISSKYVPPEKNYHLIEIALPSKGPGKQDVSYTWDLNPLNLVPEDVISYHATVFDNDMVNGPQATNSSEYTVRLPSLNEAFAQADSEHSELISRTEQALNLSDNLNQQFQQMSEDMKTLNKQMTWEQKKKMQNTVQKFDSLQKKIEDIKKQAESMTEKMLENKLLSPKTLDKYLELQKAIQEINSPEFQAALQRLRRAINSLNPDQVRQAVQNFKVNEEMLRQSIERTLSLIKRVEIEQKLDELQQRTAQMINQQDSLRKSTAEADSKNAEVKRELSDRQSEVQKEFSRTNKVMSDLRKLMSQFSKEMPINKLDQASQELQNSQVTQKMQASEQQLSQGQFSNSAESQKQIASSLQKFQQQLSETQKQMLQNQERETVNTLRKAQQNLLQISKEQEELRTQSNQSIETYSPGARSLAKKQYELMQQLNNAAQQMTQLSDKSFMVTPQMGRRIGDAYSQMNDALKQLQNRYGQTSSATGSQKNAMGSMNEAVMSIQSTLQSMMNGQGGAGNFPSLLQQLQQLAGQQQGLNALTGQLGQRGGLTMQQQAELSRLAAQQGIIRKSLEQLNHEFEQSESRDRVLGDLNAISSDMKKVERDMQNKNITQQTIQRQNKILTRMLDASRSINQQNYENVRLSKAGKNIFQQSPAQLNLSNSNSEQEQELLRLIRKNFPPEYQRVILRYYQLLKKTPE